MKKLISILGAIGLVSTSSSSVMAMAPATINKTNIQIKANEATNSIEQKEYSRQQIIDWVYGGADVYADPIDLDKITASLNETEINLYGIDQEDEQAVMERILMGVIFNNSVWGRELAQLMRDYWTNELDWLMQLPQLPSPNTSTSGEISALYLGDSGQFTGILKAKINLINKNAEEKTDLSAVLKNTNLDKIKNLDSKNIKSLIIELNPELKETDFDLVRHYDYAIATATEDSGYKGAVKITYIFSVLDNARLETGTARVDAYNSSQHDEKSAPMTIHAELGKDEFIKAFSTLNFKFNGKSWNNGNDPDPSQMQREHSLSIESDTSLHLYTHNFDGIENWMHSQGNLKLEWKGDDLVITLKVEVSCYATAWNAAWARAEATGIIENMNIQ